jgi:hypothetical protein
LNRRLLMFALSGVGAQPSGRFMGSGRLQVTSYKLQVERLATE